MKGSTMSAEDPDDRFIAPGTLKVSASALQLARGFDEAIASKQNGNWVVVFDWADSISVHRAPDAPWEDIGACLTLGAYKRGEVPPGFTYTVDGFEFAIRIPTDVWQKSTHRMIDTDDTLLFKLTLR
jgi:hypothetical protein